MKKRNSVYANPKQCYLPENVIYQHYREEFVNIFEKFNDYNQPYTMKKTPNGVIDGVTKKDLEFFEKSYVPAQPFTTEDEVRKEIFNDIKDYEIGQLEWQLILFCTGFRDTFKGNRIILLTGNVGEGKSSLVNYVLKYLYLSKPSFKKRVLPISFNCHGYRPEILKKIKETGNISSWVDEHISNFLNNLSGDYTTIDNEDFWNWYEIKFKTKYSSHIKDLKARNLSENEYKNRIFDFRENEKYNNPEFIYNSSYYIAEKDKKDIVVVFDNIDPFDINTIGLFYWKAKAIINISPIKVILSLREDTYRKLIKTIRATRLLKTIPINSDLEKIVTRRCDNLSNSIEKACKRKPLIVNPSTNVTLKIDIEPYEVVNRIIKLIMDPIGLNCISSFSCKNIRNSLELLRIIFSSSFLPISEIGNVLLEYNNENTPEIPPEYLISAIITFGYDTFFTKELKIKDVPGVINILSCSKHQSPIQIFSKIYILNYLSNNGFELNSNNKQEMLDIFQKCTSMMLMNEELMKSFTSSFHRLFTTGLISSPDIHTVDSVEEFNSEVKEVRISSLGEYYFNFLLTYPFYLIFVKDDVYLENPNEFVDTHFVYNNKPRNKFFWTNFKNLSLFLKEYGEMELNAIREFINYETFEIFHHNFGCLSHNLFTFRIIDQLENFIKGEDLKSIPLIHFLNEKQIFDTSDVSVLKETKAYLENEYLNLFKKN